MFGSTQELHECGINCDGVACSQANKPLVTRETLLSKIAELRAENELLRKYNRLLVLGHDFQCNARDGYACDCGVETPPKESEVKV